MTNNDLDQLQLAYKSAVEAWVNSIRAEEALATPDHSVKEWEKWDSAHFAEEELRSKVDQARDAYKDGLRSLNYNI